MRRITSKSALIFAFLVAVGWHQPVGATPVNFLIQFSQTFPPISGGDSPRGHFSIDDSLLNTGLDQFVHLTAVADFEVVDGPASFPSGVWFGFLHIPSSGLTLHFQGLPSDDPGSNAIAELLLPSDDPRCLGVDVPTPTHCEFALGSDGSWSLVVFDTASNLAFATGSYFVRTTPPIPAPWTLTLVISAASLLCLTRLAGVIPRSR